VDILSGAHSVTLVPTAAATRFQLDASSVRSNWTDQTCGVMVATPSNPTGTSVPADELAAICDFAREPAMERLAQNYFLCASAPAQHAALACFIPESLAVCEARRVEFAERRALVLDGLARLGLPVPVPPDGAFYVYFDVSHSYAASADELREGIARLGKFVTTLQ